MIYLDNGATTKTYEIVNKKMLENMENNFGNPSSLHRMGLNAEKTLKESRKNIANILGIEDSQIILTSGGTESNNLAILGVAEKNKKIGKHIVTTQIEHPSVLNTVKELENSGFEVDFLPVDQYARVNLDNLKETLREDTILVSVMAVNNEVGTVQDLLKIGKIIDEKNKLNDGKVQNKTFFHTDGVQSFAKIDFLNEYIDIASFSGHKIHGPKGVGGLYIKKGMNIRPVVQGGGQEKDLRSGTENLVGIIGMAEACRQVEKTRSENLQKISYMRKYLLDGIKSEIKDIKINGFEQDILNGGFASPYILNVSFLGTRGEVILHRLEEDGIFVSIGSACSSNKKGRSHVLKAMGLKDKEIEGAMRFSFGNMNSLEEMDIVLDRLKSAVEKFRMLGSFR